MAFPLFTATGEEGRGHCRRYPCRDDLAHSPDTIDRDTRNHLDKATSHAEHASAFMHTLRIAIPLSVIADDADDMEPVVQNLGDVETLMATLPRALANIGVTESLESTMNGALQEVRLADEALRVVFANSEAAGEKADEAPRGARTPSIPADQPAIRSGEFNPQDRAGARIAQASAIAHYLRAEFGEPGAGRMADHVVANSLWAINDLLDDAEQAADGKG